MAAAGEPDPAALRDGLAWLGSGERSWPELRERAELGPGGPTPLLYRLARHSLLCGYAAAAVRLQQRRGSLGDREHIDTELVDKRTY